MQITVDDHDFAIRGMRRRLARRPGATPASIFPRSGVASIIAPAAGVVVDVGEYLLSVRR